MHNPIVSVLLSVNRDRGFLVDTLTSVLSQSFVDLELIVVDDGAPVDVGHVLGAVRSHDSRVHVLRNRESVGLTSALNQALRTARGRYIARIDEGDMWLPHKLESQVRFIEDHPNVVLVGVQYMNYVDDPGQAVPGTQLPIEDSAIRRWLFSGLTPIIHPGILFRNGLLTYNAAATTSQDFDLYLRLSLVGRLANLPDVMLLSYTPRGALSVEREHLQFANHVTMHWQFLRAVVGWGSIEQYVASGATIRQASVLGRISSARRKLCLKLLRGVPKRSWIRRILRNVLIPDYAVYFVAARSAPYVLRNAYRMYTHVESPFRT